jgi:hypothetical protein
VEPPGRRERTRASLVVLLMPSADSTGLLGYFLRLDPSEDETPAAGNSDSPQAQPHLIYARPPIPRGDDTTAN